MILVSISAVATSCMHGVLSHLEFTSGDAVSSFDLRSYAAA